MWKMRWEPGSVAARQIRAVEAFVSATVLVLAASAHAGDTGMLYVKSFPSGATVVIEDKERGKTPVLVRDLPAGEVTVELRIAGVKPVTKQATVKANKVATIDVAIEVPAATLTIVSEPLEATVVFDGREVGKTPLTLEHLDPGEHSLLLLKDGCPRTARSVVLEPGSERVLEVKLGTAGGDDTPRPAPGKGAAKARGPGRVPVEVQLILAMLKDTVAKGDYSETRRNLALALSQPDMANSKEELCAAIRVVQALEMRQHHVRKGAAKLVDKKVVLRTRTGARKGRVEGVSVEGITVASRITVDGLAAGETRATIKWPVLTLDEQDRLAESWKPKGPDAAVAQAILAQARKDKAAAERAVRAAGEHPLGKYLARKSAMPVDGKAERAARSAWSRIKRVRLSSAAGAKTLLKELASFEEKYGQTRFAPSVREKFGAVKRYASLVSKLPAGAVHYGVHWYGVYVQQTTWHEAKRFCEEQGGHLVTITSKQENKFVTALGRATGGNGWIGLSDESLEGKWEWVTGEKLAFAPWGRGEPNDYRGGEDYAALAVGGGLHPAGTWNDWSEVRRKFFFICEWDVALGVKGSSSPAGARPRE